MVKGKKKGAAKEAENFRVTDQTKTVDILRSVNDRAEPITIPALMKRTVENYGSSNALMFKDEVTREWTGITYREYRDQVLKIAKVFIKLGLERHGSVAVLAFNSVEWFVSEMAAIHAGGIIAGVYTTNSVESCLHVLLNSKANIVVVDSPKQMDKIFQIKDKLPQLKAVIQTSPPYAQYIKKEDGYWRWNELDDIDTDDVEDEYQKRSSEIVANECCCLVYTSGTVGKPKGVMLSHDNITWTAHSLTVQFENLQMGKEVIVSYLPLSHIAGQMLDIFLSFTVAGTVYFADKDAMKGSLIKTLNEVRPTTFLAVPRIYEKIQEKMIQATLQSNAIKRMLGAWARNVALQHHLDHMSGHQTNSIQYKLAKKVVLAKVKVSLGLDRTKHFLTGAAPLCTDVKKYFLSLDIPIIDVFGMSESSGGISMSNIDQPAFETVGRALPGVEAIIINQNRDEEGEICVKGRNVFMGYVDDMEKTVEAIDDDRWLRTGDVGCIGKDGYLFITGRIKELIITSGGENIPPVLIENLVKAECSAISNAFLVGDKKKFLTMLVTLKTEMNSEGEPKDELTQETIKWLGGIDVKYKKLSDILAAGPDPKVIQAIQEAINRANDQAISNAQKIQKFAILPQDFSIATGELGPTMKLKRNIVVEKYNDIIEKFYK